MEGVVICFFSAFLEGCRDTDEAVHKCSVRLFEEPSSVYPPTTLTVKIFVCIKYQRPVSACRGKSQGFLKYNFAIDLSKVRNTI